MVGSWDKKVARILYICKTVQKLINFNEIKIVIKAILASLYNTEDKMIYRNIKDGCFVDFYDV